MREETGLSTPHFDAMLEVCVTKVPINSVPERLSNTFTTRGRAAVEVELN